MSRRRAQAHARRAHHCSCGRVVHGNGARSSHRAAHARRRDGHGWISPDAWLYHFSTDPAAREDALRRFRAWLRGVVADSNAQEVALREFRARPKKTLETP